MRKYRTVMLIWPMDHGNECWVPYHDILCVISPPEPQGQRARQYKLKSNDLDLIMKKMSKRN